MLRKSSYATALGQRYLKVLRKKKIHLFTPLLEHVYTIFNPRFLAILWTKSAFLQNLQHCGERTTCL